MPVNERPTSNVEHRIMYFTIYNVCQNNITFQRMYEASELPS